MTKTLRRIYVCSDCGCLFAPEATTSAGKHCPVCESHNADLIEL